MAEPNPFTFRCPSSGCNRVYKSRPELAGKLMVCAGCNSKIRIPASAKAVTARPAKSLATPSPSAKSRTSASQAHSHGDAERGVSATSSGPTRIPCPACGAVCRVRPEWQGREIQCPTCNAPFKMSRAPSPPAPKTVTPAIPEFTPDDDPPPSPIFDEADAGYEIAEDDYSLPQPAPVPADWTVPAAPTVLQPASTRKKKKRKNSLQFLEDIVDSPKLLFLFGSALAVVLIICGIMFAPLALAMRLIGSLFTLAGFVYALRMAFDESASCGVLYLLDCSSVYRIYYTVTRWPDMKHAFFAEVFGLLLFVPWVVLTTEDIMDTVPVNLDDFKGIEMEELDEPEPDPGQFNRQFDGADNHGRALPYLGVTGQFVSLQSLIIYEVPAAISRQVPYI